MNSAPLTLKTERMTVAEGIELFKKHIAAGTNPVFFRTIVPKSGRELKAPMANICFDLGDRKCVLEFIYSADDTINKPIVMQSGYNKDAYENTVTPTREFTIEASACPAIAELLALFTTLRDEAFNGLFANPPKAHPLTNLLLDNWVTVDKKGNRNPIETDEILRLRYGPKAKEGRANQLYPGGARIKFKSNFTRIQQNAASTVPPERVGKPMCQIYDERKGSISIDETTGAEQVVYDFLLDRQGQQLTEHTAHEYVPFGSQLTDLYFAPSTISKAPGGFTTTLSAPMLIVRPAEPRAKTAFTNNPVISSRAAKIREQLEKKKLEASAPASSSSTAQQEQAPTVPEPADDIVGSDW